MLNLMKNEYIKVFKCKTSIILLVLLLLAALAPHLLIYTLSRSYSNRDYYGYMDKEFNERELDWYKESSEQYN